MPFQDLAGHLQELSLLAVPFLMAITCHEAAHGAMAYALGDPTAKQAGRLTLNPFKHLDPVGTLVLVVTGMIGWAKPVPTDSRYFKNPSRDMMLVSLAGPGANLIAAALFAAGFHLLGGAYMGRAITPAEAFMVKPLGGILFLGVRINLILAFFNLIPIPPMDGSHIVAGLLPARAAGAYMSLARYGMAIIILLAVTGVLGRIISAPVAAGMRILLF